MRFIVLALCVLAAPLSSARAALLDSNILIFTDPFSGGSVQILSKVQDNFSGDFSKYYFTYEVFNINYDPTPGTSNGFSGFQVLFTSPVAGVADQFAPPGWFFNCCGSGPPFGAEADINNSGGLGTMPGFLDLFGYTVPAGTGWTSAFTGSWAHSWEFDIQTITFSLDDGTGQSILTPVPAPEPGVSLLALALVAIGVLRPRT